jgi:hypothetical protein
MEVVPGAFNIDGATHQVIAQSGADVGTVAICGWFANADADARLIAAAPELLVALKAIADDYADRFDLQNPSTNLGIKWAVEQAREAIAKATGEPNA